MRRRRDALADFRLSDAMTFLAVKRQGSLSAAARELGVTTSQVSKAIARLENQLNVTLLVRSARGVEPSDEAARVVPLLEGAISRLRQARLDAGAPGPVLTVAGPSYVVQSMSSALVGAMPAQRLRVLSLAPAEIRALAPTGIFDAAFIVGPPISLDTWHTVVLGQLQSRLFATPEVARRLGPQPLEVSQLKDERFVSPVNSRDGNFVPLDDGCPLPYAQRLNGHEAQTLQLALDLAVSANQVVFGPVAAAMSRMQTGQLVPIEVVGWDTTMTLSLALNVDRVTSSIRAAIMRVSEEFLELSKLELQRTGGAKRRARESAPTR